MNLPPKNIHFKKTSDVALRGLPNQWYYLVAYYNRESERYDCCL